MIHEKKIQFKYKGNRTYAHGTDIYKNLLKLSLEFFGLYPLNIKGAFHNILENNGTFRIYKSDDTFEVKGVSAVFYITFKEGTYKAVLVDDGRPITSSYDYDEGNVLEKAVLKDQAISMDYKPTYTYMEQFVAMTKKLHLTIYPDAPGNWLFTQIQIENSIDPSFYTDKRLSVTLEGNLQYRLTQCSLRIEEQVIGRIFFSLLPQKEFA